MNATDPISGALPTSWQEALAITQPWQRRAAFVETRVRNLLAGLEPGTVLSTAELVERLFPARDAQSPEDTGARQELFARVAKLGANTTLAVKSPTLVEKGYNKGRTINRLLWCRIDPAAIPAPAYAPSVPAPDLDIIRAHLAEQRSRLDRLDVAIQALATKVGLTNGQ